ncbi:MAG: glycosyltransferase family 4 protein [Saprospiraceae bacterium]|nr:glycosyltransferase family 4 protein [Saprospiraceae bacterium]
MSAKTKLVRITTVPVSLQKLLTGQMKFMKDNGFEVIMMSADGPEISEVVTREGCPHIIIPLTRKITPLQDLKALYILIKHIRKIKPDIVHTHTPKAGLIGMLAAFLTRVPIRIHTVAGLPLETQRGIKRKLLIAIEKITYWCANEVWPNSKSLYNFVLEHKLTNCDKLHIIGHGSTNGIDVVEYDATILNADILNEVKQKLNYSASYKYLLFVGRVVKDKGIEELVAVFKSLSAVFSNLKLIIVGPYENDLDPISSEVEDEIKINPAIISTGYSNYVKYYMHIADIFVFPSHREGFPNVLMQAALMDCPVAASRITGNVDIIEHQLNGLLFEKGNKTELYASIERLLLDTDLTKIISSKLREKIIANFDRQVVHQLIKQRYNEFLLQKK